MVTPPDDPRDVPWSIPVREPAPDIPRREATWVDRLPFSPVALVVVLLIVSVAGGVLVLTGDDGPPDPEVLGAQLRRAADGEDSTSTTGDPTTTTEPTTTTAAPTTTTSTTAVTTASVPTPAPAAPPATGGEPSDLPVLQPGDLGEAWAAQFSSVPASAGTTALRTAYETIAQDAPDVVILRGREWPSLRDGFWVIVEVGHPTSSDALAACEAAGRTDRDDCFARYLSPDSDEQRICHFDADGVRQGQCGG